MNLSGVSLFDGGSAYGNLGVVSYAYADTISYNAAGQITKERFGTATNLYHNLHYNNRHQLVDIRLGDSSSDEWNWSRGALVFYYGTTARDAWNPFANSPDNNGNVLRQLHYVPLSGGGYVLPQLDDYTYDALNRIASMTEAQLDGGGSWTFGATSQTFTYDRWGNRTSVTGHTAQSWSATEAAATNRLKLASGNQCTGTKNGLCYDAAGNLIFDNQLGATGDRSYDAEGHIITAAGGGTNKYVYDADGKRVRRQVGAQQFWQVYGIDGELIAEYEWNGTTASLQKEYGSGGGASVVAEGSAVRWLVKDHLGTPRMIADQTGSLSGMRRHDYLPFGEENFTGATIRTAANGYQAEGVRQKFTGYEHDNETDLDFAEARYCSTKQGRFTSTDPLIDSATLVDPQSWNRYSYVGNRPLMYIDPSGLRWYYNAAENIYRWFDYNPGEGWAVILGNFQYRAANGREIFLPANSREWEYADSRRLLTLDDPEVRAQAEAYANAIFGDFVEYSIKGAIAVLTGGGSVTLEAVIIVVLEGPVSDYLGVEDSVGFPSGGRLGNSGTRKQNESLGDLLDSSGGYSDVRTGARGGELYLPPAGGGQRGGNYVDVSGEKDGSKTLINTIDTRADGTTPTKREASAASEIRRKTNTPVILIPKKKR